MIKVEFTGYVNEIKSFDWGTVLKMAHSQVKKNDAGEWETVGRDYFDVIAPAKTSVKEGDKLDVVGKLKTKLYDKKDGSKGISLEVRADSIAKAAGSSRIPDTWTPVSTDDSLPF
jgi:single-stranded DNA-binding protein